MNVGHFWTPEEKADLLALSRDDFLAKYPGISPDSYRQRFAYERKKVESASPVRLADDGLYHVEPWSYTPSRPVIPKGIERHVNIGDTHGVFVDQRVWAAVLDFVRDFRPDQINCLGDMIDFYDVSRFDKNPNRRIVIGAEIEFTREVVFAELRRAAPKARIVWKDGNHEDRLRRYLWSRAPELASLPGLEMSELFRLKDLDIEHLTTEDPLIVGEIQLTHGHLVRKHSGATAKAMLDDWGTSVIHNHTHRLGAVYKTDRSGEYVAFENGCLCSKQMEYMQGVPNWQHGFSVGWVLPSGRFHFEQVAVVDGRFVFGGRFYGSDDPIDHCHD